MTFQVYTKSIKGYNPIDFIYALVSVQSHFKRRCKQGYGDNGANSIICAMREKSARPNYDNGSFYLTEVGRAAHAKMFLIQIEPRLAGYGITEVGHPRLLIDNFT